ncbi:MAG TPA: hypothetical protein VGF97_03240 [Rhizomicrobium sp.]|jgi:hypothetical protein
MLANRNSIRCLSGLRGASTARVLNLATLAQLHAHEDAYRAEPLFESAILNTAILVKHRVRADEAYLFPTSRAVATKVIIPFDRNDLRLGGRSVFVDQVSFKDAMREAGNYFDKSADRDFEVLRLIDELPSLDPFLLREHLRNHGISVSEFYFEISDADKSAMHEFASQDVRELIGLATGGAGAAHYSSTARLVSALLSAGVNEKLEPLRQTLMLEGREFREGVFSWRGFLYYKWCGRKLWPQVGKVLREIRHIQVRGPDKELLAYIESAKRQIIIAAHRTTKEVDAVLKIYNDAYDRLVKHGEPQHFREFLLLAPSMFLDLGEKMGAISHIVSFWRHRFPEQKRFRADPDEVAAIFQDFLSGFQALAGEAERRLDWNVGSGAGA